VRWVPSSRQLVLVGGGDPFLSSSPRRGKASYPDRADVQTLARLSVRKLRAMKVGRVRLAFDDSYFTGPAVNPAWPDTYIPEGVVPPISALWVDEGLSPGGYSFVSDPAATAAQVFRNALRDNGLKVGPQVTRATAPEGAVDVASVSSAPVGAIVERTLEVSDNQAAEVLARHVGLAERQEGSFQAGAAAVLGVVQRLGVPTAGDQLYDGSGLSRDDRLSPETLAGVLRLADSQGHPQLRQVFTGLPVAGFTGSLQYRFDRGPEAARGRVRAKTGTLTGVHGLAGVADDATGARMAFAVVADQVGPLKNLEAQTLIDRIAGALGACRCGVGSTS
jgi:D-alanyl-D-alanine carboxypeptidase/D-alanyl-D-alanine-endopeptidase (penicillin-binding protein 4)